MTAQEFLDRVEQSGIRLYLMAGYLVRSMDYETPLRNPCCPFSALYQHETGKKVGNIHKPAWSEHFGMPEKVIQVIMNASDNRLRCSKQIRARLLQIVQKRRRHA